MSDLDTTFPESGDNEVASGHPKYDEARQRVHINKTQYFEGVPPELWQHMVGGYQVLDKWLKDRKGRKLGINDINHYQRIVRSLGGDAASDARDRRGHRRLPAALSQAGNPSIIQQAIAADFHRRRKVMPVRKPFHSGITDRTRSAARR